jgi:thiamine-phosphate pyrophosphorylase
MTAAVHSRKNLLKGGALGIDAALVSPVFPTKSHAETLTTRTTLGLLGLSKICRGSTVPIYALGGVSDKNAMQLLKSPAIGIAGISGIADNGIQG